MKVWLVSFLILFVLIQFILWLRNFFIPLPLYLLGGACLALASNYEDDFNNLISRSTDNFLSSSENDLK